MNYCVITHAFSMARHKPEGQVPLQYLGLSYAIITHALEFSNKAGGRGKNKDKTDLQQAREDEMASLFRILPFKQYFCDKNLRIKFTGILFAISYSFEKTPQT